MIHNIHDHDCPSHLSTSEVTYLHRNKRQFGGKKLLVYLLPRISLIHIENMSTILCMVANYYYAQILNNTCKHGNPHQCNAMRALKMYFEGR